ncbi:G-protein coupled receptor GRL101-like [Stylophora pistillata]|uniref:G-protein coupled receptor GRL101-like n=1 Tax=Stylophora pistillata TaxID=50429 RepID=UPI000C03AC57|nr:G-protein coupled receptor GRL101-like [Stylophora pistillata]
MGNNNLKTLPEDLFAGQNLLKYLRLVGNRLETLPRNIFHGLTVLEELDLSYNQLQRLPRGVLSTNTELKKLDLSYNGIERLPLDVFGNLTKLKKVFLSNNKIQRLPHFKNLSDIETLYMDNNRLKALSPDQFHGLSKLKDLAVYDNNIEHLPREVFKDTKNMSFMSFYLNKIRTVTNEQFKDVAPTIQFLYFHYNQMRELPRGFFSNMKKLITATVDTNLMCCHLTKEDADCDFVYVDSFASCETMFMNRAPKTCIWVIAIMSLVGAVFVITWRMIHREKDIVQPIMLIHLAVSDGLMGVYLITIGYKDAIWTGQYYLHDYELRSSLSWQINGAIAVLSSEVSIMLLSLISADRLKNIVFPFYVGGLTNKDTHALCFTIWIIGFIIAFLPTFGIQYFEGPGGHHFYGKSVVCLPLQLSHDKALGWEYSLAVFVGLNLAFLAFVIVAYLIIVVNRCRVQAMSANTQRETALAKRVFFIILTDCICWMPVIVIGLRSIAEKAFRTRGDLAVWIAVFALPLNSAINPILYTLSTTQVRNVLKAKWQQLCNYFMAKCTRTQTREDVRDPGHDQAFEMRTFGAAGREEGPDKEAEEET